jgi:hypothetical protein
MSPSVGLRATGQRKTAVHHVNGQRFDYSTNRLSETNAQSGLFLTPHRKSNVSYAQEHHHPTRWFWHTTDSCDAAKAKLLEFTNARIGGITREAGACEYFTIRTGVTPNYHPVTIRA